MAERVPRSKLVAPWLLLVLCSGAAWWQRDLADGIFPIATCPAGTQPIGGRATIELPSESVGIWGESTERPSDPTRGFCRARGAVRGRGREPNTVEEWQAPDDLPVRLADGRLVHAPRATWAPFRGAPIDDERAKLYRAGSSFRSSALEEECLAPQHPLDLDGCLSADGTLRGRTESGPVFFPDGRTTTQAAFWGSLLALALAVAGALYAGNVLPRWTWRPRRGGMTLLGAGLVLAICLFGAGAPWALWLAGLALLWLVWQVTIGWPPAATLHQDDLARGAPMLHTLAEGPLFVTGATLVTNPAEYRADGRPMLGRHAADRPIEIFDLDPISPRQAELELLLRHRSKTRALAVLVVVAAGAFVTMLVRLA